MRRRANRSPSGSTVRLPISYARPHEDAGPKTGPFVVTASGGGVGRVVPGATGRGGDFFGDAAKGLFANEHAGFFILCGVLRSGILQVAAVVSRHGAGLYRHTAVRLQAAVLSNGQSLQKILAGYDHRRSDEPVRVGKYPPI